MQTRYHSETEIQNVECDEEEQNDSGYSLHKVEPVSWVRICEIVRTSFNCNEHSIHGVIDKRDKDATNLHEENVGDRLQIDYGFVEVTRSGRCYGVGVEVFENEESEWHNA